jgi:tellurite resistance protein
MRQIEDRELGLLYARVLVAIARADHEIELEEGMRLVERIKTRCAVPMRLEDLLLEPALSPEQFHLQLGVQDGPFRGASVHPRELAAALVQDGVAIMLAKGHANEAEADRLWRFVEILGLTSDEFRTLTAAVAPWFPTTE